jgi:hypothetical protein
MLAFATPAARASAACVLEKQAEIPVTMAGTSPLVSVELNGSSALLLADSGSLLSTLSTASAARLGLPLQAAPLEFTLQGIGGAINPSLTTVKRFTLAGVSIQKVPFVVGGQQPLGADGILGENVLGIADVDYDLANRTIRLLHPRGCGDRPLTYWPQSRSASVLQLEPSVGGAPSPPHT